MGMVPDTEGVMAQHDALFTAQDVGVFYFEFIVVLDPLEGRLHRLRRLVVIASNQADTPMQPFANGPGLGSGHPENVAQMVNNVVLAYNPVPVLNESLIH